MAEVKVQGHVVEARGDGLVLQRYGDDLWFLVRPHDAQPGDYVWIYDDGQVEVRNRPPRLPANVTEITLPTSLDPDHS